MKFNSTKINNQQLHYALLLLRVTLGFLMIANHGWPKIIKFETLQNEFFNFFGIGSYLSLILAIGSEILCSLLLIFGLYTRLALLPLIVTMLVAATVHQWEIFGKAELAFMYLIGFVFLFIVGPGQKSIDARMGKRSYY